MYDADYLNRLGSPNVCDHVGVEIPEAMLPAEQFLVEMTDAGRTRQSLQALVEF